MYAQVAPVLRDFTRQCRPPLFPQIQNSVDRLRPDALAAEFYGDLIAAQLRKNDEPDVDAQGSEAVGASSKNSSVHLREAATDRPSCLSGPRSAVSGLLYINSASVGVYKIFSRWI
jgi:hypothetical protein